MFSSSFKIADSSREYLFGLCHALKIPQVLTESSAPQGTTTKVCSSRLQVNSQCIIRVDELHRESFVALSFLVSTTTISIGAILDRKCSRNADHMLVESFPESLMKRVWQMRLRWSCSTFDLCLQVTSGFDQAVQSHLDRALQ